MYYVRFYSPADIAARAPTQPSDHAPLSVFAWNPRRVFSEFPLGAQAMAAGKAVQATSPGCGGVSAGEWVVVTMHRPCRISAAILLHCNKLRGFCDFHEKK